MADTINKNLEKMADQLSDLSLMDAASLVTILKERWNVKDTVMMGAAQPAAAEAVAVKTEFDVILIDGGEKKLNVIKVVREIKGQDLSLKDAKDLVESAPKTISENLSKDDANKIKEKLEAAGAKVELK